MLMALSNADRCSDLSAWDLNHRTYQTNGVRFIIPSLTKSRRNGSPIDAFYPSFQESPKQCPIQALREYEARSQGTRQAGGTNPLFTSVWKPYTPVKPCTIGRWINRVMAVSTADTSIFFTHSTWGVVTSKAKAVGVSTADILRAASWSSEATFCHFYHRPISSSRLALGYWVTHAWVEYSNGGLQTIPCSKLTMLLEGIWSLRNTITDSSRIRRVWWGGWIVWGSVGYLETT